MATAEILVRRAGKAALVTLNRPKALNALSQSMIESMTREYESLVKDKEIRLIVLEGAGEKAFCAGGDVRAIWEDKTGAVGRKFFEHEYKLDYLIATLREKHNVEHVALVHGIYMGGGVGVSVHSPYRIATEKTMFAMPETAIGLFPDVGGSYFLPQLPGQMGAYLGLTGARLKGYDVVAAGVATHFVQSEKLSSLKEALLERGVEAIDEFCESGSSAAVTELQSRVDATFGGETVEEIISSLEERGDEWAKSQLETLHRVSPSSLKITLRMLRQPDRPASLEEAFALEHSLASRVLQRPDFFEGVRSVLVDKDQKPQWLPPTLEEVDTDSYFEKPEKSFNVKQ